MSNKLEYCNSCNCMTKRIKGECGKCRMERITKEGSMTDLPFFAIGNNELAKKKPIGKTTKCPNCSKSHEVKYGTSKTLLPDRIYSKSKPISMGFIKCNKKDVAYLVSINGKKI